MATGGHARYASSLPTSRDALRVELARAGVPLVLCPVDGALRDGPYLDLLLDGRLGAFVVTADHADDPALIEAARTGRVIVAVDAAPTAPGMIATDRGSVALAVLTALGVQRST